MRKNINVIAAEWEEVLAEVEAEGGNRAAAWNWFVYENELFEPSAPDEYFELGVHGYLEKLFGKVDTRDGETLGEIGYRFLRSLPSAEIEDGVYAVMNAHVLEKVAEEAVRERLDGDYYDCDTCPHPYLRACENADLRFKAECSMSFTYRMTRGAGGCAV